jgi:hypothetical protein
MNAIFLLSRGSVRMKWVGGSSSSLTQPTRSVYDIKCRLTLIEVDPSYSYTEWLQGGLYPKLPCRGTSWQSKDLQGGLEFSVPMYNRYVSRVCSEQLIVPNAYQTSAQTHGPDLLVNVDGLTVDNTLSGFWVRAGADDLTFSSFVSIPPYIAVTLPE